MYQSEMNVVDWSVVFAPMIVIFMMVILIVLMIFFMSVRDKFHIILTIWLFSIIIGVVAISITTFPLNPYFQLFFILFQTVLFGKDAVDTFTNDNPLKKLK